MNRYNLLRIFINVVLIIFIFSAPALHNDKNIPVSFIFFYNILLFSPAWLNNFWLLPQLQQNKRIPQYGVSLIAVILCITFVLGQYLQWLYQRFHTTELIDFTPVATTSSAPAGLEKYQYYFDVFPGLIIVLGIMIIGYAIQQFLLKIRKEKQIHAQQTIAELSLLKSQISPHFLFNVLNSLYSLSLKKSDETPDVVLKLSDILRYSLYETQVKEVLVTDEIHILNTYIDIERVRMPDNAKITFQYDDVQESIRITPMLLLPLIENAFKHGTDSTVGHSYIQATLKCSDNRLIFTCENNFKEPGRKDVGGIGIENIRKRLQLIYPSRHRFQIEKNNGIFKVMLEIKF
ncbi:MAG: histidine kinase [Chryseobacterium sp.]|uniref:sensor histidine kinase n=1 Tax=Chryseobacterium sp. TaxID=1871047 RepID=UPI00282165BF|nr:histidine kinase [Chryseobacterium sp.]MDR2237319.1 histidine kinase [Chryseobacterium sp.]